MARKPLTEIGKENWPPENGKEFIRSEHFGYMVLRWCEELARRYPDMDFSDAASHVFAWFDGKLSKNRRFINANRFRTPNAFAAYVRQCVWNAARLARRQRQRLNAIEALPPENSIVADPEPSPEELADWHARLATLGYPHGEIVRRLFIEEDDIEAIARDLCMSVARVQELYEEAIDLLQ